MNNKGERIKKYRKEKGFTQQQLADAIGKSKSIIQKYESNSTNVNINILQEISEVLEVKLHALLYDNDSDYFKELENEEDILELVNKTSKQIDIKLLELNPGIDNKFFINRIYQLLEALDIEFVYDEFNDVIYIGNCYTNPSYTNKSDKIVITNTENFLFMLKTIISLRNDFFKVNKTSQLSMDQLTKKMLEREREKNNKQ